MKPAFTYGLLIWLLHVCMPWHASAQLNNEALSDKINLTATDSGRWGFSFNNFNYLRNTEYFNNIELGRTLFGYQLNPSLFIQPNENVKLQAGVFVRNDFGGINPYTQVIPTLSLKFQTGNASFTFGTLEGALSHRIIEPMFDINAAIERRIENGFDFRYTGKQTTSNIPRERRSFYNLWINWEKFIQRGSPYKEAFTAGINLMPGNIKSHSSIAVLPVFQGMLTHHGGQIDTDTSNMTMQLNYTLGLRIPVSFSMKNSVLLEGYYLGYRETTTSGYFPYRNGSALYANLSYKKTLNNLQDNFTFMLSYFNGNKFIAPKGTPLYQSISTDKPGVNENNRELLFVRFIYQKKLFDELQLDTRFEPVYDTRNKIFDYSYSLYLTYRFSKSFGF